MHGHVIRPYSHSLSDDEKLYRPESERKQEVERDPITRFQLFLMREGILDEKGIDELEKDVDAEVQEASDRAVAAALPAPDSYKQFVYSPDLDPTSSAFQTEAVHPTPSDKGTANPERTMADLINVCLKDEMKRDPRIVMFGEDVADCSREEYLKDKQVKGKGGVFKLTAGLQCRVRLRPRLQLAAGGGQHRGPRRRHGDARSEAGGRDSVLRLHLACHAAASQ